MNVFKTEPEKVEMCGQKLKCLVCAHPQFWKRETQLNTALATLFQLDWASRFATCYICEQCGHVHWFLKP